MRPTQARLLKLFALPLSRQTGSRPPLFYLHAKKVAPASLTKSDGKPLPIPIPTRAAIWAANQWSKLQEGKEGSWKRKAYATGDRLMDKIEFEEWALKAIDPALSPKPWKAIANGSDGMKEARESEEGKVTLLYPSSLISPEPLLDTLKSQLAHREPHHKSAMVKCLVGAPLTFPFAIVPIVPNFPLFYVLWRAWSHFRAWKASEYLNTLLSGSQITLSPSSKLDDIYASTPFTSPPLTPAAIDAELLLTLDKVPKIVEAFGLTEDEGAELRRAVVQAESRLKQAVQSELDKEEKAKKE